MRDRPNRGLIVVDTNGNWRLHTTSIPAGCTALGIEQTTVGRPAEMQGGRRVNTYLDAESIAIATRLGNGNVSDGIRKALKIKRI